MSGCCWYVYDYCVAYYQKQVLKNAYLPGCSSSSLLNDDTVLLHNRRVDTAVVFVLLNEWLLLVCLRLLCCLLPEASVEECLLAGLL